MENKADLKSDNGSGTLKDTDRGITYYNGKAFLPHFSWKTANYAMTEWEMPQNTVFVASYVKTGEMIYEMIYR